MKTDDKAMMYSAKQGNRVVMLGERHGVKVCFVPRLMNYQRPDFEQLKQLFDTGTYALRGD